MAYFGRSRDLESFEPPRRRWNTSFRDDDFYARTYDRTERQLGSSPKPFYDDSALFDRHKDTAWHSEVAHLESKLALKEARVIELEMDVRRAQDADEKQNRTIKQLRDMIEHTEKQSTEMSSALSKAQISATTLQSENRQLQDKISDMESRFKRQLDDKNYSSLNIAQLEKNYDELRRCLGKIFFPDAYHDGHSHETLLRKLDNHYDEYVKLNNKVIQLESNLMTAEEDARSSRDSLKNLLDEMERMRKYVSTAESIKEEKELALRNQKQLEDELKRMDALLAGSQEKYNALQHDTRNLQLKLTDMDTTTRRSNLSAQVASQEFKSFKESLASLLSDGYNTLPATEEALREKIRLLSLNRQESENSSKYLEEKLKELSQQLEEQAHLHKSAVQRARKAEEDVQRLSDRLRHAEGELSAHDILKHGLKSETTKYQDFLEQLARIMKMDSIAQELSMELNGDTLLARAEQLVVTEEDTLKKKHPQILSLNQQLKSTKKQLESKDLHLDVLRKKLAEMEDEAYFKAEKDGHELYEKNQKLKKQVEKLEKQLKDLRDETRHTHHEKAAHDTLKTTCDEQRKTITELQRRLLDLEQIRDKQSRKIAGMKSDRDQTGFTELRAAESTVNGLTNEVQRLKQRLDETARREKQLLGLRQVIARMLGLDVQTLAVADYEIITRMEKLVESQNELTLAVKSSTSHALDNGVFGKHYRTYDGNGIDNIRKPRTAISYTDGRNTIHGRRPATKDTTTTLSTRRWK